MGSLENFLNENKKSTINVKLGMNTLSGEYNGYIGHTWGRGSTTDYTPQNWTVDCLHTRGIPCAPPTPGAIEDSHVHTWPIQQDLTLKQVVENIKEEEAVEEKPKKTMSNKRFFSLGALLFILQATILYWLWYFQIVVFSYISNLLEIYRWGLFKLHE